MQQPMNANPVQVVVVTQPEAFYRQGLYKNMGNWLARQLVGVGASQVVIGSLWIIILAATVGINSSSYYSRDVVGLGFGIGMGLLFIIAGAFGIAGGRKRNRCQVVAFNVLSILSASFAAFLLSTTIPVVIINASRSYNCYDDNDLDDSSIRCTDSGTRNARTATNSLTAILVLAEFISALWSSVICCRIGACCCNCEDSCCCCPTSPFHNQFVKKGQLYPGQQKTMMTNQESQMLLENQED